jgi:hypothetical protein
VRVRGPIRQWQPERLGKSEIVVEEDGLERLRRALRIHVEGDQHVVRGDGEELPRQGALLAIPRVEDAFVHIEHHGRRRVVTRPIQGQAVPHVRAEPQRLLRILLQRQRHRSHSRHIAAQHQPGQPPLAVDAGMPREPRLGDGMLPPADEEEARAGKEAAARTERMKQRTRREDWAELLSRTFDFDVFA